MTICSWPSEKQKEGYGSDEDAQVSYKKHKIFLYRQDLREIYRRIEDVMVCQCQQPE